MGSKPTYEELEQKVKGLEGELFGRKASQTWLAAIYEESPIGIALYDPEGQLLHANNAFLDAFGVSGISEMRRFKLFEDPHIPEEYMERLRKGEKVRYDAFFDFEKIKEQRLYRATKSGTIHLDVQITPLVVAPEESIIGYLIQVVDITERKQTEEALESERTFLSAVLDNIEEAIIICGEDERIIRFNEAARRLHGLPEEPLPPHQWAEHYGLYQTDAITPLSQADIPLFRALGGERVRNAEIMVFPKGRNPHFLVCNGQALTDATGRRIGAIVTMHDITTRKQTEEALRESEEKFRSLVDQAAEMLFLHDLKGNIIDVNTAAVKNTGYLREELQKMSVFDIDPDARDRHDRQTHWESMRTEDPAVVFEVRHKRKDGSVYPAEVTVSKVAFQNSEYILALARDITDRKQAAEALEKQKRIHQAIIDNAHTHLVYLDTHFNFVAVNSVYAETCHRTPEELIGENHFFLYPHEENEALFKRVRDTGQSISFRDKPFEFPDQPERGITYWDWTLSPVFDDTGKVDGLVFSLVETTERKQAEATVRLVEKAESLGRMAGAIAHDYNNLLSVVMGNLEMAMLDLARESVAGDHLTKAINATRRASEITGLMLAYLGQTAGNREPLDLSMLCREFLPDIRSDMPVHVTLKADMPEPGPAIKANPAQIQQLLRNLAINACESMGEQPGLVSVSIGTASPADIPSVHRQPVAFGAGAPGYAYLEVADTGCGIAEDVIEKLFDPFYSTKFIGRGLGLPVALGTVRSYDGCITVETAPGQGSVFRVYLPLTTEAVSRQQAIPQMEPANRLEAETVLLVEDDPLARETGAMVLTRLGMNVLEAKDGIEAVEVFQKHQKEIHCVLCDLTMPRMSGWETIEALRGFEPDIPVILVSGYDQAHVMAGTGSQLPQAFLGKPYSIAALRAALARAMNDRTIPRGRNLQGRGGLADLPGTCDDVKKPPFSPEPV